MHPVNSSKPDLFHLIVHELYLEKKALDIAYSRNLLNLNPAIKLLPYQDERYEIRVKGPNVITAYFDEPEKDKNSFDEDGFFITNDAIKFVDPKNHAAGVRFDGRISEDFKLLTGIWVQAAALRLQVLAMLEELVQDVVVTGADKHDIGLLVFPSAAIAPVNDGDVVTDAGYRKRLLDRLEQVNQGVTGSSKRIARALIMAQPPSVENAEITAIQIDPDLRIACRE